MECAAEMVAGLNVVDGVANRGALFQVQSLVQFLVMSRMFERPTKPVEAL